MYNDTVENWVPLGEKHRIALHRQEYASENPITAYYDHIGCWTVTQARGLNPIHVNVDDNVQETIRRVTDETESNNYRDLTNEIVHELERIHGLVVLPVSLQGYSQGEWMEVVLFVKPGNELGGVVENVLDHIRQDLTAWFRGDVYIITLEELITYTAPNGKTITRWEGVDDVAASWDNYFYERPAVEDLLDRLEIDVAEYGADEKALELVN